MIPQITADRLDRLIFNFARLIAIAMLAGAIVTAIGLF
jgi:hypothetical protein